MVVVEVVVVVVVVVVDVVLDKSFTDNLSNSAVSSSSLFCDLKVSERIERIHACTVSILVTMLKLSQAKVCFF